MNKVKEFEEFLNRVPKYMVNAYEQNVLNGETLISLLDRHRKISRRLSLQYYLPFFLPASFIMGAIVLVLYHCEMIPIIWIVGACVVLPTSLLLGIIFTGRNRLVEEREKLKIESILRYFRLLMEQLDPYNLSVLGPLNLNETTVHGRLMTLARNLLRAEEETDRARRSRTSIDELAATMEIQYIVNKQFTEMLEVLNKLAIPNPHTQKEYNRRDVIRAVTKD